MRIKFSHILALVLLGVALYGGNIAFQKFKSVHSGKNFDKPFATQPVGGFTANMSTTHDQLQEGDNDILIEFRDSSGHPVDVGGVKFELDMNMPGMVVHSIAIVGPANTAGQYHASTKIDMAGDWIAKLSYDGSRGNGESSFSVIVK